MGISDILASVDREIAVLKQARALLADTTAYAPVRKAGRPKQIGVQVTPAAAIPDKKRKKRNLTPEGRKRIAEAQRNRWQAQRKAASAPAK
jgi:hypothetical protein